MPARVGIVSSDQQPIAIVVCLLHSAFNWIQDSRIWVPLLLENAPMSFDGVFQLLSGNSGIAGYI